MGRPPADPARRVLQLRRDAVAGAPADRLWPGCGHRPGIASGTQGRPHDGRRSHRRSGVTAPCDAGLGGRSRAPDGSAGGAHPHQRRPAVGGVRRRPRGWHRLSVLPPCALRRAARRGAGPRAGGRQRAAEPEPAWQLRGRSSRRRRPHRDNEHGRCLRGGCGGLCGGGSSPPAGRGEASPRR